MEVGLPLWLGPDPARYGGGAGPARWRGAPPLAPPHPAIGGANGGAKPRHTPPLGLGPEYSEEEGRIVSRIVS